MLIICFGLLIFLIPILLSNRKYIFFYLYTWQIVFFAAKKDKDWQILHIEME